MSPSEHARRVAGYSAADLVGVVTDLQTYKNLCYLLLALPLGAAYSVLLLAGIGFGAILAMVGVGFAILIVTVVVARVLAGFERYLANALLDVDLRRPDEVGPSSTAGLRSTLEGYLDARSTWRGLGFLAVKFWVGFVAIAVLFPLLAALSLLAAPFRYPYEAELITVNSRPITWAVESLPEALLAVAVGALLGVIFLHVTNALAYVAGRIAVALLDAPDAGERSQTIVSNASSDDSS